MCKKRSIQQRKPRRRRCSRVVSRSSMTFCGLVRREVCPFVPKGSAHRPKSPAEGVLGTNKECPVRMQPSWSAEYSQKCTVLPGGPVRVAKTMPMPTSASPFCCTDFSECRARVSQPGSRGGPEGMKFVASSARAEGHLMWPSCEQDCPSRKPYAPPLRSHTGATAKLSPGIQKI